MAKDSAVQNQKVFVQLESVMKLQQKYLHHIDTFREAKGKSNIDQHLVSNIRTRVAMYDEVIRTLDLPIDLVGV